MMERTERHPGGGSVSTTPGSPAGHSRPAAGTIQTVRAGSEGVGDSQLTLFHDPEADAAGWVAYGGVLTLILGGMYVLFAVVAIAYHEWPVWASREVLLLTPLQWGWVHLGVGVAVGLAGLGVLAGSTTGRRVGTGVVAAAMLVSFLAFTAFPLWSSVMMIVGALVLYCLVARGGVAGRRGHLEVGRHS